MLVFLSFYFVGLDAKMIFSDFSKRQSFLQWTCKYCTFCAEKRGYLLKHYHLKHGCHTRISPLPCLHKECLCTFKSFNALKVHLTTWRTQNDLGNMSETHAQEVIEQINQMYVLSQPLLHTSVGKILNQNCGDVEDSLVSEIAKVFTENNVFLKFTSTGGSLSTTSKRTSYISKEFCGSC